MNWHRGICCNINAADVKHAAFKIAEMDPICTILTIR
jgi:hypothetical protein